MRRLDQREIARLKTFMPRAIVLLSGGMDSTTCYHIADAKFPGLVVGLSIDYGQRHHKEMEYAKKTAGNLHVVMEGPQMLESTLTDEGGDIPRKDYSELEGVSPTYVPFRNGLLLSYMAALGQMLPSVTELYFGAHAEDALNWAYPDCTPEFVGAMTNAIYIGTYHKVRLLTPLQYMTKAEVVTKGIEVGVVWRNTWSCYIGGELHCGTCPTCRSRKEAFNHHGMVDPTGYEE